MTTNRQELNLGLTQGRRTYESGYPDAEYLCVDGCNEWHFVTNPCDCIPDGSTPNDK